MVHTAQTMMIVAIKLKNVEAQIARVEPHRLNPRRWNDE
jgi:hypothetical protein